MAPPDESKSAQVTKTSNQISRHFKKCGLRKVEFKKQKSLLIEKELQAHFIRAKNEKNEDDLPRVEPRQLSPKRSASQDALEAVSSQSLGRAVTRFAASHPEYMHPVIHPGAMGRPMSESRLRRVQSSERLPEEGSIAAASPPASPSPPPHEPPAEVSGEHSWGTGSSTLFASKIRRGSPKKRTLGQAGAFGFFPGTLEREETEEDRLFSAPSREEELLATAEADAAALRATWDGGLRPPDPPDMIERLGHLMALLGPRYRTMPREAIWEKAVVGSTSSLQRLEKRLGPTAAHSICGFARTRGAIGSRGRQGSKNRTRSPEWLPDYDPDGPARAAWLRARERENEMKAKAHSRLKVSSVSNLGTSLSMSTI